MYKVIWEDSALEGLAKIDYTIAKKIKTKVETYLVKDPLNLGKPLTHEFRGFYRYRCYDAYRVIYKVKKSELLILVVKVGHRREIY